MSMNLLLWFQDQNSVPPFDATAFDDSELEMRYILGDNSLSETLTTISGEFETVDSSSSSSSSDDTEPMNFTTTAPIVYERELRVTMTVSRQYRIRPIPNRKCSKRLFRCFSPLKLANCCIFPRDILPIGNCL